MIALQEIYLGDGKTIKVGEDVSSFGLDKKEIGRLVDLGVVGDEKPETITGISTGGNAPIVKQGDDLGDDLGDLSVKELKDLCVENGIEIPNGAKKADLIKLLEGNEEE